MSIGTGSGARPGDDSFLSQLVFEYLERRESEGEGVLAELCAKHPALAARLRGRLGELRGAGLLAGSEGGTFPETLGDFRLLERLGAGGMGVVFLAEQVALGRRVALKLIRPDQLYFGEGRERFRREVEAAARLAHPGIVPVHTVGEERGVPYFAMELVAGVALDRVLRQLAENDPASLVGDDFARTAASAAGEAAPSAVFAGAWWAACARVVRQVAEALEHAHRRGVVHRDVKPSNVMLTPAGRAMLVDFGLASRAGSSSITRTGARLGSLPYMTPEQIDGRANDADPSVDVYALGVTLYELLTLRQPFVSDTTERLLQRIVAGHPPSMRKRNPAVPADLETVCLTAMDLDPARRYPTAEAFARDLTCVLERRPIEARRASAWLRALRWTQRRPAAAAAAVLAFLLLVGTPAGLLLQQLRANERLGRANTSLQQAHSATETAKSELEVALSRVEVEKERAESNLDRALQAVERMLARVGEVRLEDVPGAAGVRRELLEDALAFYGELIPQRPDEPQLVRERARLGIAMADVLRLLGRNAEAERTLAREIALLRELVALDPRESGLLADGLQSLGRVLLDGGRTEAAQSLFEECVALRREIVASDPTLGNQYALAVGLMNLCLALRHFGHDDEAIESYAEAASLLRVAAAMAESPTYRSALADALSGQAALYRRRAEYAEARNLFEQAIAVQEDLLERASESRRAALALLDTCGNLGNLLAETGEWAAAEGVLVRGAEVAQQLADGHPNIPEYKGKLCAILNLQGMTYARQARWPQALDVLERSVELLEPLVDRHPGTPEYRKLLGNALGNQGGVLQDRGDLDAGLEQLERAAAELSVALDLEPASVQVRFQLGVTTMNCGENWLARGELERGLDCLLRVPELCRGDPAALRYLAGLHMSGARRAAAAGLADEQRLFEEGALRALQSAVESGYAGRDLLTSEELAPLRERPEFRELAAVE